MRIDETRHDDLAAGVNIPRATGADVRPYVDDALAFDQDVGLYEVTLPRGGTDRWVHRHDMPAADHIAPAPAATVLGRILVVIARAGGRRVEEAHPRGRRRGQRRSLKKV